MNHCDACRIDFDEESEEFIYDETFIAKVGNVGNKKGRTFSMCPECAFHTRTLLNS